MTVHTVNRPGGWCTVCGENDDHLRTVGGVTIEYDEFTLTAPEEETE